MKKVFEPRFYKRSVIAWKVCDTNENTEWDPQIKHCIHNTSKGKKLARSF